MARASRPFFPVPLSTGETPPIEVSQEFSTSLRRASSAKKLGRWRPGWQSQPSLLWSGVSRILCPLSRTGDHLSHAFFTCPGPLFRVRPIPEVYSPLARQVERATHTSALSCTTWGLSCDLAYAKIRWALTPPFHPCPAPSLPSLDWNQTKQFIRRSQTGAGWCRAVYFLRHFP